MSIFAIGLVNNTSCSIDYRNDIPHTQLPNTRSIVCVVKVHLASKLNSKTVPALLSFDPSLIFPFHLWGEVGTMGLGTGQAMTLNAFPHG